MLQQIPSPLEISVLLKESGTKYDHDLLNSPDNLASYNSNYKKALNLGIFGTDLGYTNIYEQNQDGIKLFLLYVDTNWYSLLLDIFKQTHLLSLM